MNIHCDQCDTSNNETANYCKVCGKEFMGNEKKSLALDFEHIIGHSQVTDELCKIIKVKKNLSQKDQEINKKTLKFIVSGDIGIGKTSIAETIASVLFKNGIVPSADILKVDFDIDNKLQAKNITESVLLLDITHKFKASEQNLDHIKYIKDLSLSIDKNKGLPIFIVETRLSDETDFFLNHPDIKNKFHYIFNLETLSIESLMSIAINQFKKQNFNLSKGAKDKLKVIIKDIIKRKDVSFGNAYTVNKLVEKIINEHHLVSKSLKNKNTIYAKNIKGKISKTKSLNEIYKELNDFIGMVELKKYIRDMVARINIAKKDAQKTGVKYVFGEHLILTGNPGTGKTSIARKLGEIFASIGLLPKGHVVEVDRKNLVGEYLGHTAPKTNKVIDEAMGGILFIDEAYTLAQDNFGKEAIDTLLKRMEDDRGKLMVVVAGYQEEMKSFIEANPGLKSRFKDNNIFHIEDYNQEELFEIYKVFVKKGGYSLDPEVEALLKEVVNTMHEVRDENFANAREIRNFYELCLAKRAVRLQAEDTNAKHDLKIHLEDLSAAAKDKAYIENAKDDLDTTKLSAKEELNSLIGLHAVKEKIIGLSDFLEVEKLRSSFGGKKSSLSSHFVFKGNPGTGKTTVARILARIFKEIGLLPKGQLIEVDRANLVGKYLGHTAPKTNKAIEDAMGGVLFIDEAYTLGRDIFGKEAIDTLLKRMEDDRGKFIVIVAGYHKEMDEFLDTNSGLTSRFTNHIDFEDYDAPEMLEIFNLMLSSKKMNAEESLEHYLMDRFNQMLIKKDKKFANGRTVRNLFEKALIKQGTRLAKELKDGNDISSKINTIIREDFK